MVVELYKKIGKYQDKETGKDKQFVNFYLKCGDQMIRVEPVYFPSEKYEGRDPFFLGRKSVMEAFATILPEKDDEAGVK